MDTDSHAPIGIVGHHYWVQNKLGIYRSAAATATYKLHHPASNIHLDIQSIISQAVIQIDEIHSPLSWGLVQANPQSPPSFIRLKTIGLDDILQFHNIEINQELLDKHHGDPLDERLDSFLAEKLSELHAEIWTEMDVKPLWKCVVFNYLLEKSATPLDSVVVEKPVSRLDVVFLYHHSMVDGSSGLTFHKTLQMVLNRLLTRSPYLPLSNIHPPPTPVEQVVKINLDTLSPPSNKLPSSEPSIPDIDFWTASPPSLSDASAYKSCTRLLQIPRTNLDALLRYCRANSTTLTGLLHGMLIISLARNRPTAEGFKAVTPYSLRPYIIPTQIPYPKHPATDEEISCSVSGLSSAFTNSSGLLTRIRQADIGSSEEMDIVIEIAKQFRSEMKNELDNVAKGDVPGIRNMLRGLSDTSISYEDHCLSQLGKKRAHTYELSNIKEFVPQNHDGVSAEEKRDIGYIGKCELRLEKMVFTQCGMVTGAAIGCSVVSTQGGPLVIGFTWQEGVVEVEFVEKIVKDVRESLMRL